MTHLTTAYWALLALLTAGLLPVVVSLATAKWRELRAHKPPHRPAYLRRAWLSLAAVTAAVVLYGLSVVWLVLTSRLGVSWTSP